MLTGGFLPVCPSLSGNGSGGGGQDEGPAIAYDKR